MSETEATERKNKQKKQAAGRMLAESIPSPKEEKANITAPHRTSKPMANRCGRQAWWGMTVIPTVRMLRQEY